MNKPQALDLFCCGGGAAKGYADAGFEVVGVDIEPQPNYPFDFIQADAIEFLDAAAADGTLLMFDAVHASPPCQRYSQMSNCNPGLKEQYPDLIGPVRQRLIASGLPFVIENVEGSPLENPLILCGSHFGLTAFWPGVGRVGLRRHRGFECHGFNVPDPGPHDHTLRSVSVVGGGVKHFATSKGGTRVSRDLMGIDWTTKAELNEAIPPAYTKYIGQQILVALTSRMVA